MTQNLIAVARISIDAGKEQVWKALVDPAAIKEYMFGADVHTDWEPGSPITWSGEWNGKPYEDKGTILECVPGKKLAYTHFSPLSGADDIPENYHHVSVELTAGGTGTELTLRQDGNASNEERDHSQKNWEMMLGTLKAYAERGQP